MSVIVEIENEITIYRMSGLDTQVLKELNVKSLSNVAPPRIVLLS